MQYNKVSDVFDTAKIIRTRLSELGESQAATELGYLIDSFWTTSSEALGELIIEFRKIRSVYNNILESSDVALLDSVIDGADRLLGFD